LELRLLLVTFSLRNANKDYTDFFVTLRGNALNWWHFIEQTCVVTTYRDPDALARLLIPHMEKTDSLLVTQITPHQFQGWLPQEAWDWLGDVSNTLNAQLTTGQIFKPLKE
jgi:hypothetical protein